MERECRARPPRRGGPLTQDHKSQKMDGLRRSSLQMQEKPKKAE